MDAQIQETNKNLEVINRHGCHLHTLKHFVQAKKLVEWLKANIEGTVLTMLTFFV